MQNTTLVIMAAGLGSRFGGGIKQLTPVGPNQELIIDYSIYDAITAGFNKIVFIIRKDIEADFMEMIGNRIEKYCKSHGVDVCYTYQDVQDVPAPYKTPNTRKKPWGTGHAVLAAKKFVREPFVVINADDYYGKVAFKAMHDFIISSKNSCMAGFTLKNTLSENGGVTRGICKVNNNGYLTSITEAYNIIRKDKDMAISGDMNIPYDTFVSMNMWGLQPEFIQILEDGFSEFLATSISCEKSEYLLPQIVGNLLSADQIKVKVLPTPDKWVGVTYQEDKQLVVDTIHGFITNGLYPENLYE